MYSCLLHRSGKDDRIKSLEDATSLLESCRDGGQDPDKTSDSVSQNEVKVESHIQRYRLLTREIVAGSPYGDRIMQFPSQVQMNVLRDVITREFRSVEGPVSEMERIQLAFLALKELNEKLARAKLLDHKSNDGLDAEEIRLRNETQAALYVSPLPWDPAECVKPGTFLVSHPFVSGYFHRTVVCILDHKEESSEDSGGTYGLIVNRIRQSSKTGQRTTLQDVLRTVPPQLSEAFGQTMVRDGGPVHVSLQMIHATTDAVTHVGGNVLSMVTDGESSTALNTDRAIYFEGDVVKAAEAVKDGVLHPSESCSLVLILSHFPMPGCTDMPLLPMIQMTFASMRVPVVGKQGNLRVRLSAAFGFLAEGHQRLPSLVTASTSKPAVAMICGLVCFPLVDRTKPA